MSMNDVGHMTGDWDYTELPPNVVLGDDCFIERRASFYRYRSERERGLVLGDRVTVYTWTEFNIEPDGLMEVGDDAVLVGAVVMCAEHVSIGARTVISYNVTIADSDFHPHDPQQRRLDAVATAPYGDRSKRPPLVSEPVSIGEDVWIGIGAFILKGVQIGAGAVVDAASVVTSDVPVGARVAGNPARIVST